MKIRHLAVVLAAAVVLGACSSGPGEGGRLDGTDWILQSYDLDGTLTIVPETLYADASFDGHRVTGFSGCNQYDAVTQVGARLLLVGPAKVTLMACDEPAMALESAYLALLDQSRWYTARGGSLTIFGPDGRTLLVFDAAPRNPLRGNWVVDSFESAPNTVSVPLEGTELTVVFGWASVGGLAGCNSFSGTYGTNGDSVRIGALATTRMACDQPIMDQETAFLEALQGVSKITTRADSVSLTDRNGSIKVALRRPALVDPDASPAPSGAAPSGTPAPSATATPSPTPSPTPPPTPSPTPKPTAAPTPPPTPTPGPTLTPPPSVPPTATCDQLAGDRLLVTLTYPAAWSTLTEPPELACRYFDPEAVAQPEAPSTAVVAAVSAISEATTFADAVAAATDPASWDVTAEGGLVVGDHQTIVVEATALADSAGIPVGETRLAYLIDLGGDGTLTIATSGPADDPDQATNRSVTTLMAATAVFPTATPN